MAAAGLTQLPLNGPQWLDRSCKELSPWILSHGWVPFGISGHFKPQIRHHRYKYIFH